MFDFSSLSCPKYGKQVSVVPAFFQELKLKEIRTWIFVGFFFFVRQMEEWKRKEMEKRRGHPPGLACLQSSSEDFTEKNEVRLTQEKSWHKKKITGRLNKGNTT